jgi:transposase-like protein
MRCLHCDKEFPASFLEEWERSDAARSGHFSCPHCAADHVRREIGRSPAGRPEYSIRLWGHLSENRRRKDAGKKPPKP